MLAHVGSLVLAPAQFLPGLVLGALYWRRARVLSANGRAVAPVRQACFYGGLALVLATFVSPLAHMADELFWAHMAEHLLIADLGALAMAAGLTGPILQPILRIPALAWLRHLAHPVVAVTLWSANLVAWHTPVLHEAALGSEPLHGLQHVLFVGLGLNMWLALIGPLPSPTWFGNAAKLVYIIGVRLISTIAANVFVWGESDLYAAYAPGRAEWGLSASTDQVVAGSIMMVEGSLLTIGLFAWVFLRSAREGEERQALLDLADDRGVALSERRAARAVAAGQGDRLRTRIEDG
ncbi:MAG TPA: cytochrome c oxidase assembly protein, partial [Solirubrobacteraceae bacterium]|nr:cytochrome c oxidase assembly protein [Solirubrobacteraceae bacterium]